MKHVIAALVGSSVLISCSDGPSSTKSPTQDVIDADGARDRVGVVGSMSVAPLRVRVYAGGYPVAGVPVRWSTNSGSVTPTQTVTDQAGIATATWTFGAEAGAMHALAEVPTSAQRALRFDARVFGPHTILLRTNEGYPFLSARNGSTPAMDTIPVGGTITWRLDPFDYDDHTIDTFGASADVAGDFPYANPSEVRATYLRAGTFEYSDTRYGGKGTVVVR